MQNNLIKNLNLRGFIAKYFRNSELAVQYILKTIPQKDSVAFGGSETAAHLKIAELLLERGNTLLHKGYMTEGRTAASVMRDALNADWYISGINALTASGGIVNTDGRANRVASTLYGPQNVLFVAGKNKIVNDIGDAIERVRKVAAPLNCKRLGYDHPCTEGEGCSLCDPKTTICRATVIHHHPTSGKSVYVVLIDEELGF